MALHGESRGDAGGLSLEVADRAFEDLRDNVDWRQLTYDRTRYTSWYVKGECRCRYRWSGDPDRELAPVDLVKFAEMKRCMDELETDIFGGLLNLETQFWPTCASLNYYPKDWKGERIWANSVGWHADEERLFGEGGRDCTIVIWAQNKNYK